MAAMVPQWRVLGVGLFSVPNHDFVELQYGRDKHGGVHYVKATLRDSDVREIHTYLVVTSAITTTWIQADMPDVSGGEGDELPVPTIRESMLSEMVSVGGVQ
jgi:hypothetical protein